MAGVSLSTIFYALLGGVIPSLVWLYFWLREDTKNPEPERTILRTFLLGMLAVVLVLPVQKWVEFTLGGTTVLTVFLWAAFEEIFKFSAGYFGGLHSVDDNEPVDPMIYMITAALGFVALENTLFIFGPLLGQDYATSFITGNLRFIGASLLHVVSSGIIGFALSLTFYKSRTTKIVWGIVSLVFAILFHLLFNLLIIIKGNQGTTLAFLLVWLGVMILLLSFEKAKSIVPKIY
jgi:RsiW-degrading membrane proteinase PrsW (M82 family)